MQWLLAAQANALLRVVTAVLCCAFFLLPQVHAGTDPLEDVLREWVAKNVYLENDRFLIIRDRPVRAYIKSANADVTSEAQRAIKNFADAFGLDVEFVTTKANLALILADKIADSEGKPSRGLLASVGLTESDIDLVIGSGDKWTEGCGAFVARDKDSHIQASILAIVKTLPANKLHSCVTTGVAFSFGLRIETQQPFANPNDYILYLWLARSLANCNRRIAAETSVVSIRELYLDCVTNDLKAKLKE